MFYLPIGRSNLDYKFILAGYLGNDFEAKMDEFIYKAGVEKGKYAGELIVNIYRTLTTNLIDLKYQFNKYYIKEYDSFSDFLYHKYLIDEYVLDYLYDFITQEDKTLYFSDFTWNTGYNLASLLNENEKVKETINNILKRCD